MALWWPCRLVVLLELFILWHSLKPCTADIRPLDGACELINKTVFDQYASTLIPPEKRFMLFVSNILTGLKDVESIAYNHVKCTGTINNDVIIQPCNSSKLSQKWFQTQNHLINVGLGKCLTTNFNQGNQLSLADCKLNDHNQKWVCSGGNDISSLLSSNGQRIFYINGSHTLQLVQAENEWKLGIAGEDAFPVDQATAVSKLCVAQNPFCSRPNPGVRSQLVTSQVALQKLLHLPQEILLKHSKDSFKHCYSVGEVVLTVCPIGYVAIGSQSKMYQASTCLGGGVWSEQHPLHCVKRRCGRPKDGFHSTFLPETVYWYGDVVRYTCQADCIPDSSTRICGPDGQWSGSPLICKHSCYFSLNRNSGTVRSPNYPQPYPPKTNCKWFIKVGEGLRLVLWFRDFFIEPGSPFTTNCRHDVFFVNDTNLRDGITQYCGSLYPEHWIATGNAATLGFYSDGTNQGKGFKIEFNAWNSSMSSIPTEPIRNGTFPDEEDQTHVYKASEYGGYFIEIVYGVLVISAVCLVLMIILSHFFDDIRSRVYPESHVSEDDFYDESDRRRRLAQRRMTTVFDSAMLATPTIVVNDNLVTEWMAELDSANSSLEEASLNEKVEDNINELPNVAIENEVQSQNIVTEPVQSGQKSDEHPDDNSTPNVQAQKGVRFNNDKVDISTSRDMQTSTAENKKEIPAGTTKNYRDRKTIFPKR